MRAIDSAVLRKSVGRRVAELRTERSWSQAKFAEKLGVVPRYLTDVERGRENLTLDSLAKLANALGVRVRDLFERPKSMRIRRGRPPKRTQ